MYHSTSDPLFSTKQAFLFLQADSEYKGAGVQAVSLGLNFTYQNMLGLHRESFWRSELFKELNP